MSNSEISEFSENPVMKDYITTTEAAQLLSVAPDTVLRWVKAGKLISYRTPGGHCRIPREAVSTLLTSRKQKEGTENYPPHASYFQHCWEFNSTESKCREECQSCIVYKSRARRCYELIDLLDDQERDTLRCTVQCEECGYYRIVRETGPSVLVVAQGKRVETELAELVSSGVLRLQSVRDEYECAMKIEQFRPDFIILDSSLGMERAKRLCQHVGNDPRIPFVRIILASKSKRQIDFCKQDLFGWIQRPLTADRVLEYIESVKADSGVSDMMDMRSS
jgi:excisionase family DNA binding protein